jgi:hypothetical protein
VVVRLYSTLQRSIGLEHTVAHAADRLLNALTTVPIAYRAARLSIAATFFSGSFEVHAIGRHCRRPIDPALSLGDLTNCRAQVPTERLSGRLPLPCATLERQGRTNRNIVSFASFELILIR